MEISIVGAGCFGAVVGWLAHAAYWTAKEINVQWMTAMLGVIGGGAITALFQDQPLFGSYCIGLAIAFFLRQLVLSPLSRLISEWFRLTCFPNIPLDDSGIPVKPKDAAPPSHTASGAPSSSTPTDA